MSDSARQGIDRLAFAEDFVHAVSDEFRAIWFWHTTTCRRIASIRGSETPVILRSGASV